MTDYATWSAPRRILHRMPKVGMGGCYTCRALSLQWIGVVIKDFSLFSLYTDIDCDCDGNFFSKTLTFQKSCLHILDVSCVDEIEQGFSQKTARRVSQHISQPG